MNKIMKVLTSVKIFMVICLFAGLAFATDPGGPSTGIGSPNGPQVGTGSNVCGTSSGDPLVWIIAGILFLGGAIVAAIMLILTGKIKENLPNQNKPNFIESPCYTSPDSEPIPCTGPEARIVDPSGASNSIALKVGANSIGRDSNQDIVMNDPKVSKIHADLNVSPSGKYVVTDLGSQNGTTVNGTRISQQELYQGDQIGVGDSRIIV